MGGEVREGGRALCRCSRTSWLHDLSSVMQIFIFIFICFFFFSFGSVDRMAIAAIAAIATVHGMYWHDIQRNAIIRVLTLETQ